VSATQGRRGRPASLIAARAELLCNLCKGQAIQHLFCCDDSLALVPTIVLKDQHCGLARWQRLLHSSTVSMLMPRARRHNFASTAVPVLARCLAVPLPAPMSRPRTRQRALCAECRLRLAALQAYGGTDAPRRHISQRCLLEIIHSASTYASHSARDPISTWQDAVQAVSGVRREPAGYGADGPASPSKRSAAGGLVDDQRGPAARGQVQHAADELRPKQPDTSGPRD